MTNTRSGSTPLRAARTAMLTNYNTSRICWNSDKPPPTLGLMNERLQFYKRGREIALLVLRVTRSYRPSHPRVISAGRPLSQTPGDACGNRPARLV